MAILKLQFTPIYAALVFAMTQHAYAKEKEPLSLGSTNPHCVAPTATMVTPAKTSGGGPLLPDYTRLTANKAAGQTKNRAKAEGDVIMERNTEVLNAEWVDVDLINNVARAGDQFTLSDSANNSNVSGENLVYNFETKQGEAEQSHFETETDKRRLQGVSDKMLMLGENRYQMQNAKVNTCDPGDDSWHIRSSKVTADYNKNVGVARNATLVFKGVPILYTPWMDFPLNGGRKSGLLVPTIKTGSNGFELSLPYYFNLAPNYDATIAPQIMTNRGVALNGEFRYLQPNYSGTVRGKWMPDDKKSEYNNRYVLAWQHQQKFNSKFSGGVDFNQTSDDDFIRDLGSGGALNDSDQLNRQAWLDFNTAVLGGGFSSRLEVQKYQTLQNRQNTIGEPYQLMPRLTANWARDIDAYHANVNVFGQFTNFEHSKLPASQRAIFYPSIEFDFSRSWGYVRPKIGLHLSQYNIEQDKNNLTPHATINRSLPIVSVDSGLIFDRPYSFWGKNYIQTLEPRIYYAFIPSKDQSRIPNFDSSEDSMTYESMFRENRFSGQDRINTANQFTTALMSRFLAADTGAEHFKIGIGQRIYLSDDDVSLSGTMNKREQGKSDVFVFGKGQVHDKLYAESQWHYNQNQNETESYSVGARYEHAPGRNISLRYRYDRNAELYAGHFGTNKQVDVGAQWAVNNNYSLVARQYYSITYKQPLEQLLGVEYKSDCGCWNASLVAQRYVNALDEHKNAVFFQLQLRDLSGLGNNPIKVLRESIPTYQPLTDEKAKK